MLKGKIKQVLAKHRQDTKDLSARKRLEAFVALDSEELEGKPGVKWLRKRKYEILTRLNLIDRPVEPWKTKWKPRSRRWTASERRLKRATAIINRTNPNFVLNCFQEIEKRNGELSINSQYGKEDLQCVDIQDLLAVFHASGFRRYGQHSHWAQLSYLCGIDDSGYFAVRVAGSIKTVSEAVDWLTPAAVKKAMKNGKQIIRQGDIYAVETAKQYDGKGTDLLERHTWDAEKRELSHPEHTTKQIPFYARFFRQRAYVMGRSSSRSWAD